MAEKIKPQVGRQQKLLPITITPMPGIVNPIGA
jgi:hypothetical protein